MKYHLPALLHYEDRNSMRYSIEARLPFLDYKLVEVGYNMSNKDKLKNGLGKIIIRESLRGIVPNEILDNKLKKGFGTPQKKWMLENKDIILNKIEMLFKYDIFNSKDLNLILQNFKTNLFNESLIMRLYTLSVWMSVFKINRIT
jgi:asparagine synthase (glutamine-hydrolysing)